MKVHLSRIPEEGLRQTVNLALASLERLVDTQGTQPGRLEAEVLLRNHGGTVDVSGRMRAILRSPCQRCLDPVEVIIDEPLRVTLAPRRTYAGSGEDVQLGAGELELSYYDGEEIDLSLLLEDELLLLVPEAVAEEDEQGRCVVCGRTFEEIYSSDQNDEKTHPFGQLGEILKNAKHERK